MENTPSYFETWLSAQEKLFAGLIENTKRAQQMFVNQHYPAFSGDAGGFNSLYSSWLSAVMKSLAEAGNGNQDIKDNLSRIMGGTNAYMKLYEVWAPLMKAAQERSLHPDAYKDYMDPAAYKGIIDKIFGFDTDATQIMLGQATQLLELIAGSGQQFTTPWLEASKASLAAYPQFMQGHPESYIKIFHSMFNAFDNTVGKIFHVPPVGKDREKFELILRGFDDLTVYAAKNTEYQHTIYITGLTAMEKVVERLAEKIKSGEEIKKFDEFFDIWIDTSEQAYFKLFQTEDFAKLQGELLDTALNVRSHFFKVMEMHLSELPIALRSEMDDLYKTVYDLKKTVKKLEKQLKEES
jgi:hypothetical protein